MKTQSLGFKTDDIIELTIPADFSYEKTRILKDQLLSFPEIIGFAANDKGFLGNRSTYDVNNVIGENHQIRLIRIDEDFLKTLELELLEGEDFTIQNLSAGNDEIIVNEKFFSTMNMEKETGEYIEIIDWQKFKIRGIIKDFHFDTMRDEIQALMLIPNTNYERLRHIYIKFLAGTSETVVPIIKRTWDNLSQGREINYYFLDDLLASRYKAEEGWGKIVGYASLLAILISSLGLFGLTLMIVNVRIKEIGIRKVNGASIGDIMLMLNKSFITKILVAFLIACPFAYYIMVKWLADFASKTPLSLWIFILAGAIILLISLLTVNWQCWQTARKNPIEALKYE